MEHICQKCNTPIPIADRIAKTPGYCKGCLARDYRFVAQPRMIQDILSGNHPFTIEWQPSSAQEILARRELARTAPADQNFEQHIERLAMAVGDDTAARIMAIANNKDWSGERKMEEILRLDQRFAAKTSSEWATMLGVSNAAVRGYSTWKTVRKSHGRPDD
jgi:hypothetical protein